MDLNYLSKEAKQTCRLTDLGSTAIPDTDAPATLKDTCQNK